MLDKRKFYINGKWVSPSKPTDLEVINPSNEDPYAVISLGSKEDIDKAVKVAKTAFESWKKTSKEERLKLLEKLLEVYKKRFNEMAKAISDEMALGEAWTVAKKHNLDLKKAFEGIKISSGNSFVHETESQVILNGSYNINFTMDLVEKDMSLFNKLSKDQDIELEIAPFVLDIFKDAKEKFGSRAWSSLVVKRLEDTYGINFREKGFPDELIDNEPEEKGQEV